MVGRPMKNEVLHASRPPKNKDRLAFTNVIMPNFLAKLQYGFLALCDDLRMLASLFIYHKVRQSYIPRTVWLRIPDFFLQISIPVWLSIGYRQSRAFTALVINYCTVIIDPSCSFRRGEEGRGWSWWRRHQPKSKIYYFFAEFLFSSLSLLCCSVSLLFCFKAFFILICYF